MVPLKRMYILCTRSDVIFFMELLVLSIYKIPPLYVYMYIVQCTYYFL
jgi:hypothetical protein